MIRFDKDKLINKSEENKVSQNEEIKKSENESITFSQLNDLSLNIVNTLMEDNIPPTPSNYDIYFEKIMDDMPLEERQKILKILELELSDEMTHRAKMELDVKESFLLIKSMMGSVANLYKNLNHIIKVIKKRRESLSNQKNNLTMLAFENDLNTLVDILNKHLNSLKSNYEKTVFIIKGIESNSIFDSRYGVYNKRYFIELLEKEKRNISILYYSSTILAMKISDETLEVIKYNKDKALILRTIAKMVLETSRRSDVVAHYEDGIFIMMLKHADLRQAEQTSNRIKSMIRSTNFIIDSKSVVVEVDIGISQINAKNIPEETISSVLDDLLRETNLETV